MNEQFIITTFCLIGPICKYTGLDQCFKNLFNVYKRFKIHFVAENMVSRFQSEFYFNRFDKIQIKLFDFYFLVFKPLS